MDKLRLLFVNDRNEDLNQLRNGVKYSPAENQVEIYTFGPNEAKGYPSVGNALLAEFGAGTMDPNNYDVLFADHHMPGMNGAQLVNEIISRLGPRAIPIIMMSRNLPLMFDAAVEALELGARGYIGSMLTGSSGGRKIFWAEVLVTARRAFQDNQRERWSQAAVEISAKRQAAWTEEVSHETIIQDILTEFQKHAPNLLVIVRTPDPADPSVLKMAGYLGIKEKAIKQYSLEMMPISRVAFLRETHRGTICLFNSLGELRGETPDALDLLRRLNIERGMAFPLKGENGEIFGTIGIYRRNIDPSFTELERNFAQNIVSFLSLTMQAREARKRELAATDFLKTLADGDEDEIYAKLVEHLHKTVHRIPLDIPAKTSFKVRRPGSHVLQIGEKWNAGVPRERIIEPRIDSDDSISAHVFRENQTVNVPDVTKEKHYWVSHSKMKSLLCAPVSPSGAPGATVFGVVNLEVAQLSYYRQEHAAYVSTLCHIAGLQVEQLRSQSFLLEMVDSFSKPSETTPLIRRSFKLIKDLTGYALLMFLVQDQTMRRWELEHIDGVPLEKQALFKEKIEQKVNNPNETTLLQEAFKAARLPGQSNILYVPDLKVDAPGSYWDPADFITDGPQEIRSQCVFVIGTGENIVGALSLDFITTNPLSISQRLLLASLSDLLAILFRHKATSYQEALRASALAYIGASLCHKTKALMRDVEDDHSKLRQELGPVISNKVESLFNAFEKNFRELSQLPVAMRMVLQQSPETLSGEEVGETWNKAVNDLALKAARLHVRVNGSVFPPNTISAPRAVLEMIFYLLLDNAIDASAESSGFVSHDGRLVSMTARADSQSLIVIISDTGKGFEPNWSLGTTTKRGGTGLGLLFVDQKMRDLNGRLELPKLKTAGALTDVTLQFPLGETLSVA